MGPTSIWRQQDQRNLQRFKKKKSGEDGHGAFGYHIDATCVTTPSSLKAGPGLNVHPLQYPTCVRETRKMNFLIPSVVPGPNFDPCCHFLGPRKLRQEGVCGVGWEWGDWEIFCFSLSKQQPMWSARDRDRETNTHSWLVALILPLAPLKTNPSTKLPGQTELKRELAAYILDTQSTSRSPGISKQSLTAQKPPPPPRNQTWSVRLSLRSTWLLTVLPWIPGQFLRFWIFL